MIFYFLHLIFEWFRGGFFKISDLLRMVLVLGGVVLDEAPIDSRNLFHAAPHLKEAAAHVASLPPKVVSPIGLLYLHQREFAVTFPHDSKKNI